MIRYVTRRPRPRALLDDTDGSADPYPSNQRSVTVHEPLDEPQPTGLFDRHGNELMREAVRRPVGFVHAYEPDE